MADPLGMIGGVRSAQQAASRSDVGGTERGQSAAASFKDVLKAGVEEVNRAQQEATRAVEDLAGGERTDVEGVVLAAQKADNAFRMLQALRNKMVEAYDEMKQMRV